MQKSKIKVGEVYEIEVEGLTVPGKIKTSAGEVKKIAHGYTFRGVSEKYGKKTYGKVVSLNQPRPIQSSAWSRYKNIENNGVVVEFEKPVKVGYFREKTPVKSAVLSTRHILRLKSEAEDAKRKTEEAQKLRSAEARAKADTFAPEILRMIDALDRAGLKPTRGDDGIDFEGGSLSFAAQRLHDGSVVITGWGWRSNFIKPETLLRIAEAAAVS